MKLFWTICAITFFKFHTVDTHPFDMMKLPTHQIWLDGESTVDDLTVSYVDHRRNIRRAISLVNDGSCEYYIESADGTANQPPHKIYCKLVEKFLHWKNPFVNILILQSPNQEGIYEMDIIR